MMRGMYAAISGLEAHQTMLDVTSNNLANVDTIGYKAQRATFVDELSQTLSAASGPNSYNGGTNAKQVGLGVQVGSIDNMMSQGSNQSTGNATDVLIQGEGFFQVDTTTTAQPTTPDPNTTEYTRAGNFTLNSQGYLMAQTGQYVVGVGATAQPDGTYTPSSTQSFINIPTGSTGVSIGQDGSVSYVDENSGNATYGKRVTAGYIQLASFPNEAGLEREGGSMWKATSSSGSATTGTPGNKGFGATVAGSLEMSNVDLATEFTNMITAERGYQANSKVITTADTMLQSAVNMVQG